MNAPSTDRDILSVVHDTLASAYRRQVLRYLVAGEGDVASVEDLVDELIDHDETAEDRRRVAVKLRHATLPKLAARAFIEYDERSRTVRYRESPALERELSRSEDETVVA